MKSKIEYKTKDLGEAAAILCNGIQLLRLESEKSFYWFIFDNLPKCEEISHDYWFGSLTVEAKRYQDALRTLKDRLFARH